MGYSQIIKCPDCGSETKEQKNFKGLFSCVREGCNGCYVTVEACDLFEEALQKAYDNKHKR